MYDIDGVFDEIDKITIAPIRDDEWTIYELVEKDQAGRTYRMLQYSADKLVKAGKWKKRLAARADGRRVNAYSLVDKDE